MSEQEIKEPVGRPTLDEVENEKAKERMALKAEAYDVLAMIDRCQYRLQQINDKLRKY